MVGATFECSKCKVWPVAEVFYEGESSFGIGRLISQVGDKFSVAYRQLLTRSIRNEVRAGVNEARRRNRKEAAEG
jgi:hypothetical protein